MGAPCEREGVVYHDDDRERLLGVVERRSWRCRLRRKRAAQTVGCVLLAVITWFDLTAPAEAHAVAGSHALSAVGSCRCGPASLEE